MVRTLGHARVVDALALQHAALARCDADADRERPAGQGLEGDRRRDAGIALARGQDAAVEGDPRGAVLHAAVAADVDREAAAAGACAELLAENGLLRGRGRREIDDRGGHRRGDDRRAAAAVPGTAAGVAAAGAVAVVAVVVAGVVVLAVAVGVLPGALAGVAHGLLVGAAVAVVVAGVVVLAVAVARVGQADRGEGEPDPEDESDDDENALDHGDSLSGRGAFLSPICWRAVKQTARTDLGRRSRIRRMSRPQIRGPRSGAAARIPRAGCMPIHHVCRVALLRPSLCARKD